MKLLSSMTQPYLNNSQLLWAEFRHRSLNGWAIRLLKARMFAQHAQCACMRDRMRTPLLYISGQDQRTVIRLVSTTLQFRGLRFCFDPPQPNLCNLHLASATYIRCQNRSCRNQQGEFRSSSSTVLSNIVMKMARPTLTLFREVDDCAQLMKERHRREWAEPSTM